MYRVLESTLLGHKIREIFLSSPTTPDVMWGGVCGVFPPLSGLTRRVGGFCLVRFAGLNEQLQQRVEAWHSMLLLCGWLHMHNWVVEVVMVTRIGVYVKLMCTTIETHCSRRDDSNGSCVRSTVWLL